MPFCTCRLDVRRAALHEDTDEVREHPMEGQKNMLFHRLAILCLGAASFAWGSNAFASVSPDESTLEFSSSGFEIEGETDTAELELVVGFGCYGPRNHNEYECNRHCKSNGFTGGYCNLATLWFRCDCYR